MATQTAKTIFPYGQLAFECCGKRLPLQVMQSNAGFYIGTSDEGLPCSRESNEYYRTEAKAQVALRNSEWSQKETP
jgi:hypothetical protein